MSELAKISGAPNTTAMPGYSISAPRPHDCADAEREAVRQYGEDIAAVAGQMNETMGTVLLSKAADVLSTQPFSFGSPKWRLWAMGARGVQYLTLLSVRHKHPMATIADISDKVTDAVANVVLGEWGLFAKNRAAQSKPSSPSTGESSSSTGSVSPLPSVGDGPTNK